jgi:hypothetical protein
MIRGMRIRSHRKGWWRIFSGDHSESITFPSTSLFLALDGQSKQRGDAANTFLPLLTVPFLHSPSLNLPKHSRNAIPPAPRPSEALYIAPVLTGATTALRWRTPRLSSSSLSSFFRVTYGRLSKRVLVTGCISVGLCGGLSLLLGYPRTVSRSASPSFTSLRYSLEAFMINC